MKLLSFFDKIDEKFLYLTFNLSIFSSKKLIYNMFRTI